MNIDNDRYMIDGKPRQVMLSVRELNTESMPNRSWVNERLTFTHGYGLTLGPVNQVTTEGLPVLFVRDLPPVSTVDLRVDQPERVLRRVVEQLRPRQDADSPSFTIRAAKRRGGAGDVGYETTFYDGTGGVPVGSLLRRLLFAHPLPQHGHPRQQPDHGRQPDHVPPAHRRARARSSRRFSPSTRIRIRC